MKNALEKAKLRNMMQNTAPVRLILARRISVSCACSGVYFSSNETSGTVFSLCLEVFIALYSGLAHMNCMREMFLHVRLLTPAVY